MSYEIVKHEQGSDQWKLWRQENIGASDAPVIQEVSPFKTLLQLWEEKIEGNATPYNQFMERGTRLEPEARQLINKKTFSAYAPICVQSNEHDWMIASLDGWDEHADTPGIEIKCPGKTDHSHALNGHIPEHYYPQLQHQMIVTDQCDWLYVSYNPEFEERSLVSILVRRNYEYGKHLVEKEFKFLERLINFDPPTPTDRDLVRIEDPEALRLAKSYAELNSKIKELELEEKKIRDSLISCINHPRAQVGDLKVNRIIRQGNVQYAKIPELQGVNLNSYRGKPIESWRIT